MNTNSNRLELEMIGAYLIQILVLPLKPIWRSLLILFTTVCLLTACDSSSEETSGNASIVDNNLLIAKALYFDKRIPDDFYHETSADDSFVSISHVKNTAILPPTGRGGLSVYELSSDDFVEAMTWDEQATTYQPLYSQLVDNSETKMYYQFTRVNPDLPEFKDISRVFKASMLDRTGVDRNDENGEYQGKVTISEMTADDIKKLVEYLWMFSYSNNYGNAVLESYMSETADEYINTMKQAKINFSYDETCDEVELYEIRYSINKASGLIWKDKILLGRFASKRSAASVEICK